MKAIVTGSEGFIGRHLCCHLEAQGHEVIRIDAKLDSYVTSNMPPADALYHLAANPSAPGRFHQGCLKSADMAYEVAYWWQKNKAASVVFASTWMVNVPCHYGADKWCAEDVLLDRIPHDKLRIIRLRNVYGPGGHGVLDIWRQQIAEGKPITIHGDGSQVRQFIHVDDVVKVLADPPKSVLTQLEGMALPLAQFARSLRLQVENVPARDTFPEINYHLAPFRRVQEYLLPNAEGAGKP